MAAPLVPLNNGLEMPVIGLGTYNHESDHGEIGHAVKVAIDAGYRHFDCAFSYGNEQEIGAAIRDKIKEGVVKRGDLFIVSKLWNNSHEYDSVVPACRRSLELLGLVYLDLYLIHWPVAFKEGPELVPRRGNAIFTTDTDYVDTWRAMEECVRLGITQSIGLSNFNSEQVTRVLENAIIKPTTLQVECNTSINQKPLIQFCKQRDIVVTAYSPLGQPFVTNENRTYTMPGLSDEKVLQLALKYRKTPAQIILRYLIENGAVPIPQSIHIEHIAQNFDIFDFSLNVLDLAVMDSLNTNERIHKFSQCKSHQYYPFSALF